MILETLGDLFFGAAAFLLGLDSLCLFRRKPFFLVSNSNDWLVLEATGCEQRELYLLSFNMI